MNAAKGIETTPQNDLLLKVRDLKVRFDTFEGQVRAVDGVNLDVGRNESVGLVGETGCGKSVTAMSIMRLIPESPGKVISGSIIFKGQELMDKDFEGMRAIRGKDITMVFQKPMSSLNPTFRIGTQMEKILRTHQKIGKKEARDRSVELLKSVRIANPEDMVYRYPHELSGGMLQRVMIGTALSSNPSLLIADEPTTALDATIQKQILGLILDLRREFAFSLLFISHDLRTVYNVCDRLYVMYAGSIMESGDVEEVFDHPLHPYFHGLLNSLPRFGVKKEALAIIHGTIPSMIDLPSGCKFHPRCPVAFDQCPKEIPRLIEVEKGHQVACFRVERRGKA